jgi:threonine dehydrogenase-like Zn-dependent dehydrogenase
MRAVCWQGVNKLSVERVPDPSLINPHDAIIKVAISTTCGSDLHLLGGYVPTMRAGDIIGHEFVGEIVETGAEVKRLKRGDRVIAVSILGCGSCSFCEHGQWSLCDNSNPNDELLKLAYGSATGGILGYSHAFGGFAGSHAEYVRLPFAEHGAFRIPDGVSYEQALFLSDAAPTGYMGADLCNIQPGDVVAIWGAGGVGQMAARCALLLGASRVVSIDRFPYRLKMARERVGADVLNYEDVDIYEALMDITKGRGPDACIDAVGMEAHGVGLSYLYDKVKTAMRLETDRPEVLREAIRCCRKGGTISVMGVYGGYVDKFPIGAAMNKGLTLRMGQQHGQRYVPILLDLVEAGHLDPSYLITHRMPLEDAPKGYELFKNKEDSCMRAAFYPEQERAVA